MIQRQGLAVVEDGQVVVGVAGQPDHIRHRQQRAATLFSPLPPPRSRKVVVTMIEAGKPLC